MCGTFGTEEHRSRNYKPNISTEPKHVHSPKTVKSHGTEGRRLTPQQSSAFSKNNGTPSDWIGGTRDESPPREQKHLAESWHFGWSAKTAEAMLKRSCLSTQASPPHPVDVTRRDSCSPQVLLAVKHSLPAGCDTLHVGCGVCTKERTRGDGLTAQLVCGEVEVSQRTEVSYPRRDRSCEVHAEDAQSGPEKETGVGHMLRQIPWLSSCQPGDLLSPGVTIKTTVLQGDAVVLATDPSSTFRVVFLGSRRSATSSGQSAEKLSF